MADKIRTVIQKDPTTFVIQKDPEVNYNRSQAVYAKEQSEQIKTDIENILITLEDVVEGAVFSVESIPASMMEYKLLKHFDNSGNLLGIYVSEQGGGTPINIIDAGIADHRYFTKTELNSGELDGQYYTKTQINNLLSNVSNNNHTHSASAITSGVFSNSRISESSVVQYQSALSINASQISGLNYYTDSDFDTRLNLKTTDDLNEGTTNLYWNTNRFNTAFNSKSADDLSEGTNNQYYKNSKVDTYVKSILENSNSINWNTGTGIQATVNLSNFSTDDLNEGSNLYFTQERVDDRVNSLIQNGTGISWNYNDTNNTLTPTILLSDFTTSDLSEGSNLYWTNSRFDIRFSFKSTDDLSEGSDLYFTNDRAIDAVGNSLVDTSRATWNYNNITKQISLSIDLSGISTNDISEGNNLYFTNSRVENVLSYSLLNSPHATFYPSNGGFKIQTSLTPFNTDNLSEGSINRYYSEGQFINSFSNQDTDDLTEGVNNLYWTNTRFDSKFNSKTTDDLNEGNNLYFTQERVDDRVASLLSNNTGISWSYNDNANILIPVISLSDFDTDDLPQGINNEYYSETLFNTSFNSKTTDDLNEGINNLYLNTSNFNTLFNQKDSDDISEGITNLYFSNGRVRNVIATTIQNTSSISWNYNSSTQQMLGSVSLSSFDTDDLSEGVNNQYFTEERVDDRVAALLSNAGNIKAMYNDTLNTLELNLDFSTFTTDDITQGANNLYFNNELVDDRVSTLITNGTGISWSYNDINGELIPTISLSPFNTDNLSEGTINRYYSESLFNTSFNSKTTDDLNEGVNNKYFSYSLFISRINNISTDELPEGTTNLYWEQSKFDTALNAKSSDDLSQGTTNLYFTNANFDARFNVKTTDDLAEGISNKYFSNELIDDRVSQLLYSSNNSIEIDYNDVGNQIDLKIIPSFLNTDLITEGSNNLYYTQERVLDDVAASLTNSNRIVWGYDDTFGKITATVDLSGISTDDISEGTNLFYTDERVEQKVAGFIYDGKGITWEYNDIQGYLIPTVDLTAFTTNDLSEGFENLFYTDVRVAQAPAVVDNTNHRLTTTGNPHQVTLDEARLVSNIVSGDINMDGNIIRNLGLPNNSTDAANRDYVDSKINGLDWQESIIDFESEVNAIQTLGNRYIADSNGSTWTQNYIYEWNGADWDEIIPDNGTAVSVDNQSFNYTYNGTAWVSFGSTVNHSNLVNLSNDDHLQYHTDGRALTWLGTRSTSDLPEGSNLYYTTTRFDTRLATKTTDDLSEGVNSLYFTNERVDDRIANTIQNGTGISWNYNDVNNTLTPTISLTPFDTDNLSEGVNNLYWTNTRFDNRFATKTTSDLSEGTNLYWTSVRFDTRLATKTTDDLSEGTSNLYFTNDRVDLLIQNGTGISWSYDGVNETLTPTISLTPFDTDDLSEGTTNKYYSETLFNTSFNGKSTDDLSEGASNLYYTTARFDTRLATKTTDDLSEGASNLYFTNERVDDRVSVLIQNGTGLNWSYDDALNTYTPTVTLTPFDTGNLTEGTNLYYTDERVDDRVNSLITAGSGISWSYDDVNNTLTPTISLSPFSTSDLSEGTNLYYTDARFDTRFNSKSTTDLSEGTNLYYTDARFDTRFGTKTTDDLTEGITNLYLTSTERNKLGFISVSTAINLDDALLGANNLSDVGNVNTARNNLNAIGSITAGITGATRITNIVQLSQSDYDAITSPDPNTFYIISDSESTLSESIDDRVGALIQDGTGISWSYDDTNNTLTPAISLTSFSTDDLSEGTNLYYTATRTQNEIDSYLVNADRTFTNNKRFADTVEVGTASQKSTQLVVRNVTSDATTTNLYTDGISTRINTINNTVYSINAEIVGVSNDGTKKSSYTLKATYYKGATNASATILGIPKLTNHYEDVGGWDIDISADTTNGTFDIQVTGESATTINWVAFVTLTQVSI